MCRNIKTLFNFDPPATDEEVRASALQYVRKISGSTKPSHDSLVTTTSKDREAEAAKARARAQQRFGKSA